MTDEQVEIEQKYRYDGKSDGTIYVRVNSRAKETSVNLMVLQPTEWSESTWVAGKPYFRYPDSYLIANWTLIHSLECLECEKKNPCREYEVLCYGCRV